MNLERDNSKTPIAQLNSSFRKLSEEGPPFEDSLFSLLKLLIFSSILESVGLALVLTVLISENAADQ